MRIARYLQDGDERPRIGLVRDGAVVEVPGADDAIAVMGDPQRHLAAVDGNAGVPLDEVTLLAPYVPRTIWAVGLNYRSHADEVGSEVPTEPMLYIKPVGTVGAPNAPVRRPLAVRMLDYEAELGLVIGAGGTVAGFVVTDDVSARDFLGDRQFTRMKSGDGFTPMGPWITTADEVEDPYDMAIRTWVDGELRQDASTADMVFTFEEVLETLGAAVRAREGDLIITGTPAGVGLAAKPQRFLEPGQVVRIEIEGLGVIEHAIEAAPTGGAA